MRKVIQCERRADVTSAAIALFPGITFRRCSECDAEVAVTKSSLSLLGQGFDLVCRRCVKKEAEQGRPMEFGAMTDEQVREFTAAVLTPRGGRLN